MKQGNAIFTLILLAGLAFSSFAAEGGSAPATAKPRGPEAVDDLSLHIKIASMRSAVPPFVSGDRLLLSAKGPWRFVAAAFEHEGFAILHPFDRNNYGVFVLAFRIPLMRSNPVRYRLIVDAAWMSDPSNPNSVSLPDTGITLSVADVPFLDDLHPGLYRIFDPDTGIARFVFRAPPGEVVTVCGDFDNWDPFIHEMIETRPGLYELALPLLPGPHWYAFVWRGELRPDPLNPDKASNKDGKVVSYLLAER